MAAAAVVSTLLLSAMVLSLSTSSRAIGKPIGDHELVGELLSVGV